MPGQDPTLSTAEARSFYDRLGARQDSQVFYEKPALDALCRHADFEHAKSVFELGCGTGRFAEELLRERLPRDARYVGTDLSATMIGLARGRLGAFAGRAELRNVDGSPRLPDASGSFDRFVSTYVLDLLSADDIRAVVAEAQRTLTPGGRLCLAGLTPGRTPLARLVSFGWQRIHRLRPALVGGCRPLAMRDFLPETDWELRYHGVVAPYGLASEVLVAVPRGTTSRS